LRNVLKSFFISSKLSKNSCSSLFFQSKWGHHYFSEDTNYFSEGMMKHTTSFSPHKSQHCYFFMPASFLSLPSIIIASEIIECLMMSWENMLTFCEEIAMNVLFCKKKWNASLVLLTFALKFVGYLLGYILGSGHVLKNKILDNEFNVLNNYSHVRFVNWLGHWCSAFWFWSIVLDCLYIYYLLLVSDLNRIN
jgi:hypothetical protein